MCAYNRYFYHLGRERNYRYLKPRIIVEPLIFDKTDNDDFKFFCYKGEVKFIQVDIDRRVNHRRIYIDKQWNNLNFSIEKPKSDQAYPKPQNLDGMIALAECLSKDFEFIRVDLYTDGKDIFVGELTNCPDNINSPFIPRSSERVASKILFD